MKLAHIRIRTKLYAGFGALATILIVLVAIAYTSFVRFAEANDLNARSEELIKQAYGMREGLANIQTAARGFALTATEEFLAPMQEGRKSFDAAFDKAKLLASGNPQQLDRLQKLRHDLIATNGKRVLATKVTSTYELVRLRAGKHEVGRRPFGRDTDKARCA